MPDDLISDVRGFAAMGNDAGAGSPAGRIEMTATSSSSSSSPTPTASAFAGSSVPNSVKKGMKKKLSGAVIFDDDNDFDGVGSSGGGGGDGEKTLNEEMEEVGEERSEGNVLDEGHYTLPPDELLSHKEPPGGIDDAPLVGGDDCKHQKPSVGTRSM